MAVGSSLLCLPLSFSCIFTEPETRWEVFSLVCDLPKILFFGCYKSCQMYQRGISLLQYTLLKGEHVHTYTHTEREGEKLLKINRCNLNTGSV